MKDARIPGGRMTQHPTHLATPGDYARVHGRLIAPSAEAVAHLKAELAKQKKKAKPQPAVLPPVIQAESPAIEPAAPAPVETEPVTIEQEEQTMTQVTELPPVTETPAVVAEPVTFAPPTSKMGRKSVEWTAEKLAELHQLYLTGVPIPQVEAAAGCKMATLRKTFQAAGLQIFPAGKHPQQRAIGKRSKVGSKAKKSTAKAAAPLTPAVVPPDAPSVLETVHTLEVDGLNVALEAILKQLVNKVRTVQITINLAE